MKISFVSIYVNNENNKNWQLPKAQTLEIDKSVRVNWVSIIYRKLTLNWKLNLNLKSKSNNVRLVHHVVE